MQLYSLLLPSLLCGCTMFHGDFNPGPKANRIILNVHWVSSQEISAKCSQIGNKEGPWLACATVYGDKKSERDHGPEQHMWVVKPESWEDHESLRIIGHELMHNLGARHP